MRSLGISKVISIIAGNKPEFSSTTLEQCKQAYLAQEGASKDIESYSAQSSTKHLMNNEYTIEQQWNIQANTTKETVVSKIESMPFEHATELAKASTQSDFLSI